jgi:hypothetical protein
MTIKDESDKGSEKYHTLTLAEFIEFLSRSASKIYYEESWSLAEKIEALLDELLPQYDLHRVPRGKIATYASSSEESLEENEWSVNDTHFRHI